LSPVFDLIVAPDGSVMSLCEGEREVPKDLPEREFTRGWLKAPHRALKLLPRPVASVGCAPAVGDDFGSVALSMPLV
jgi:hypothetical protein